MRSRTAVVGVLLAGVVAGGCADQQEKYCDAVEDHQQALGEVLGSGGSDALLKALPDFRELADEAPQDVRDEWKTFLDALEGLGEALDDAGVDPATYDRDEPPAGLGQDDKDRIDAAARTLADPKTVAAFDGVQQHARDVCGTPLSV